MGGRHLASTTPGWEADLLADLALWITDRLTEDPPPGESSVAAAARHWARSLERSASERLVDLRRSVAP